MNQKCQQKKKEEEKKAAKEAPTQAEPSTTNEVIVTGEESTVTVPLVEPKEEKALSMRSFVILGITAAVFDVFYAPCTAMGNSGDIPLSPYV